MGGQKPVCLEPNSHLPVSLDSILSHGYNKGKMKMLESTVRYLTVPEVAARFGMTTGRVHQLLKDGEIVGMKHGRDWAIPETEIARYNAKPKDPRGRPRGGQQSQAP